MVLLSKDRYHWAETGDARFFCALVAALFLLCSGFAFSKAHAQDISGGAGEGVKRPSDNTSKRRPKSTKRNPKSTAGTSQAKVDVSKQVDAALELGNNARDSNPPRFADAEQAYKLAMGLDPEDARAYVGLGNTYFDQKRYSEAEVAFTHATQLDPDDSDALVALAYTKNAQESYTDSEQFALRAIALDANSYTAYVALGWSKFRRKNYQEAETAYRRAIALSPKTPEIYSELSSVLMAQGRWQDDEPVLLEAVTLDPDNATIVVDYAFVLHKLGQLDKAAEIYTRAITLDSKSTPPHSNLALIQYTKGDFPKAREEWESALKLKSTYELDHIGLLILDRKYAEANTELEKYTQANADDEDGWLLLGDVRRMRRDQAGATAAYARAAQIAPAYAQHGRPTIPEPPVAKATPPQVVKEEKKASSNSQAVKVVETPKEKTPDKNEPASEPKLRYASSLRHVKPTGYARPTPASGAISVSCNPNSIVVIEPLGGGEALMSIVPSSPTVVAFSQLRPGEYLVTASLDGYEPFETQVFVAATKIISVKLQLRPKT